MIDREKGGGRYDQKGGKEEITLRLEDSLVER